MLQLHNTSPFVATILGLPDQRGREMLLVVVKATFTWTGQLALAARPRAIVLVDEYWGDPSSSSLRYPSEVHLPKPGCDVVVNGHARAPQGRPVIELDVGVRIAERVKRAHVHGDRMWTEGLGGLRPSQAHPFVDLPLLYERAAGGQHDPRNPVGLGEPTLGQLVPNIEDPSAPISRPGHASEPVGFGAIAPAWQPRVAHAGTYDHAWQTERAPFLPDDFDARYFNMASSGLHFATPLIGGEPIVLVGFDPRGIIELALPRCRLAVVARVAGRVEPLPTNLETVILEPSDERMTMTWRASLAVGRDLLRVRAVEVGLDALEGALS